MRTSFRRVVLAATLTTLAAAPLLSVPSSAAAADYPTRPVTMVAPVASGGILDFTARLLAEGVSKELGVPVYSSEAPRCAYAAIGSWPI